MKLDLIECDERPIRHGLKSPYAVCDLVSVRVLTGMSEILIVDIWVNGQPDGTESKCMNRPVAANFQCGLIAQPNRG